MIYFSKQGIVTSEGEARKNCMGTEYDALLIGSTRTVGVAELINDEFHNISSLLFPLQSGVPVSRVGSTSKKCFLSKIGFSGTVLSSNDNIVVQSEDNDIIVQTKRFLDITCGDNNHEILIEGFIKPFNISNEGEIDTNVWSGFSKVKSVQPNDKTEFFAAKNVKRKVLLYKHAQTNLETVVDYTRKLKSITSFLVPVYPEKEDMLLIQGEEQGDVWHGKVLSVNMSNKTVEVHFFVEKQQHPNKFVRESFSRQARNSVGFDSIIGIADGHWISGNSWQKSNK